MNDNTTTDDLPELSDATIDRIERAVLEDIADERPRRATASTRAGARRRGWLTGAGIAAAFVVGVLVTPPILTAVGGSAASTAEGGDMLVGGVAEDSSAGSTDQSEPGAVAGDAGATSGEIGDADREIIATGNATLRVDDIAAAAAAITALADDHGGYVESTEVGKSLAIDDASGPAPDDPGYGWISIRVPSDDLTTVIDELAESGEVLSTSISQQDVTSTAIDLRARIDATRASVERLTELMSQTGTVADLIEAEVALTDRQAQLESYEQQLASLEDQVAMSSLQIELTRAAAATTADPAGFGDGLLAGWNGLVVALNALVVSIGFLLPWLGLVALVVLVVWLIRRARHARRDRSTAVERGAED